MTVTTATALKDNLTSSSLSLNAEDWDRSDGEINPSILDGHPKSTPRNSVVFPRDGLGDTPGRSRMGGREGRSLSELMRLHAEKETDVAFSVEEVSRVADVLKQWINSGTSPYEGEDDFFARSQDDSSLGPKRSSLMEMNSRPRGQSETLTLRFSSSNGSNC